MNLIIDIGNTQAKVKVFDKQKKQIESKNFTSSAEFTGEALDDIKMQYPEIEKAIVSSVVEVSTAIIERLEYHFPNHYIILDHDTPLPIENCYRTKTTLGFDRLAAAVGANNIFPDSNVLIIDLGTAITFDFVNRENQFVGGNISPGMAMRFKALHYFTHKLPHLKKKETSLLIGESTESAIIAGVQNGIAFEIDAYINIFKQKFGKFNIILTGGDAFFFDKKLKNTIFAEPNLVSIGLNEIVNFNFK